MRKRLSLSGSSISESGSIGRHRILVRFLCAVLGGLLTVVALGVRPASAAPSGLPGIDVSNWTGSINWSTVYSAGYRWTYILATDGYIGPGKTKPFVNQKFTSQYVGSYRAGLIHGAFHFARLEPQYGGGVYQARWFLANGGRWSPDGRTLPGALDLEETTCALSQHNTQVWVADFLNTYRAATGRDAVIYTTPNYWSTCVGSWPGVTARYPLWISNTGVANPHVPTGWPYYTMWQWIHGERGGRASGVTGPVDLDVFNGSLSRLQAFATG